MQVREKSNIIKTKRENPTKESTTLVTSLLSNKVASLWFKLFLSFLICYLIFHKLLYKEELINMYQLVTQSLQTGPKLYYYVLLIILIPVNWGLEAKKWHLLVRKIEPVSFLQSYKAVLSGVSFNILAPFGLGDALSRTYFLQSNKRIKAIGSLVINRVCQLMPTLIFGLISVIFIFQNYPNQLFSLLIISLVLLFAFTALFVFKNKLFDFLSTKLKKNVISILSELKVISTSELINIALLSIVRYCVFSIQFLLALAIFQIDLPVHILLLGISWIFLVKTIVPSLSIFSDLAARELSALFYFGIWGIGNVEVTAAIILIWLTNIIIPAILGVLFIPNLKLTIRDNN